MPQDRIGELISRDVQVRNEFAQNNRRSVAFPADVARAMVTGSELLKRASDPRNVRAVITAQYSRNTAFSIVECEQGVLESMEPPHLTQLLSHSQSHMVEPYHDTAASVEALENLGIQVLQHWTLKSREAKIDRKRISIFEPDLMLAPNLRGRVGRDSFKRVLAGARKLGFNAVLIQTHIPFINYLRRQNFIPLADMDSRTAGALHGGRSLDVASSTIKPLDSRTKALLVG